MHRVATEESEEFQREKENRTDTNQTDNDIHNKQEFQLSPNQILIQSQHSQSEEDLDGKKDQILNTAIELKNQDNFELLAQKQQYTTQSIVILGILFCLNFSAYGTTQSLIVQLYSSLGYDNLGNIALFIVYGTFSVATFITPGLVQSFQKQYIMMFSVFGYSSFIGSGIFVSSCLNSSASSCSTTSIYLFTLITAAICGICASTLWVIKKILSCFTYIFNIFTDILKQIAQGGYLDTILDWTPLDKGKYISLFWMIHMLFNLIGIGIAAIILSFAEASTLFIVLFMLSCASGVGFVFLPGDQIEQRDQKNTVVKEKLPTLGEKFHDIKELLKVKELYPFLSIICYNGCSLAYYSGFLYIVVVASLVANDPNISTNQISSQNSYVFICLGFAEILGGWIASKFTDTVDLANLASIGSIFGNVAITLSYLAFFLKSYPLCFICSFFWGLQENFLYCVMTSICTQYYTGQIEIFSLYNFFAALSSCFIFILTIALQDVQPYVFIAILNVIQLFATIYSNLIKKPQFK